MTVRELADKCELSHSTISDIENGRDMPSHLTMLLVCVGLNKPFAEVFETNPDILDSYFGRNTDQTNKH
jgi:transcriptional regulator with XRE-family HTH domain